jgi:hypothetical protein
MARAILWLRDFEIENQDATVELVAAGQVVIGAWSNGDLATAVLRRAAAIANTRA